MLFISGIIVGAISTMFLTLNVFLESAYMVCFAAFAGAIMTIFIDYLIAPKQIFGFWQNVLKKLSESKLKQLAKPLGNCIYCMNVYVFAACFVVLYYYTNVSWWYFIPGVSLSHVLLAYIDRKINS